MRAVRAMDFLTNGNALRFDDQRLPIAKALCLPWFDRGAPPLPDVQNLIKTFLVERLGNPQTRAGRWVGVESEAALVRRWLTRASLKVFFDLISDHALDAQWRYRETFWTACLNKGAIDDAWLVLGHAVHASARARESLGTAFGRLEGGNVSADQSVLLLRIGPLIISEWSHNGKMRAYPAGKAPRLWQSMYSRGDLTVSGLPFPADPRRTGSRPSDNTGLAHMGSATGVWQRRAARLLAQYASFVLTEADWRVQ